MFLNFFDKTPPILKEFIKWAKTSKTKQGLKDCLISLNEMSKNVYGKKIVLIYFEEDFEEMSLNSARKIVLDSIEELRKQI